MIFGLSPVTAWGKHNEGNLQKCDPFLYPHTIYDANLAAPRLPYLHSHSHELHANLHISTHSLESSEVSTSRTPSLNKSSPHLKADMHLAPMPKDFGELKIFSDDLHCRCNQQINPSHISASTGTNELRAGVSTNTKISSRHR